MKKNIHPESKPTTFKCATCGSEFVVMSTIKSDNVGIDVCSNCHPIYKLGSAQQKIKGRSEKLAHKFANIGVKKEKKVVQKKVSNKKSSLLEE